MRIAAIVVVAALGTARADAQASEQIRSQLQLDLGLSVIGVGFELPASDHVALQAEAFIFGTYFLPWFDLGDRVVGFGGGVRATYFPREGGRGLYVTPYVRVARVTGQHDEGVDGTGVALEVGAFVGYAFRLTGRLDLRVGAGAQYIYIDGDNGLAASTPFVALDAVVGYRF